MIELYRYIHSFSYKLNQGENIQPCHTPFPILTQAVVPCLVLTVASWRAYRFLRRQVRWSRMPISLTFPVCCDPQKGFSVVNEAEVDVSWAKTVRPPKPGNTLPGPLQENSAHPALGLCRSKRGLWTSILGLPWKAVRTRNLVSTSDLLTQNLRIPGESCSRYSQRSAGLQALRPPPAVAPSPGAGREGQAAWPPGVPPLQSMLWAPGLRNPWLQLQCPPPSWGPRPRPSGGPKESSWLNTHTPQTLL